MKFTEYSALVSSDLYRHEMARGKKAFLKHMLLTPGFSYIFWIRTCAYLSECGFFAKPFFRLAWWLHRRSGFKYGLSIPWYTKIGAGFYIGHPGGIVVNGAAVIGKNFNISQGVTIGQANRGPRCGVAVIGDSVYVGPGAKLVGRVVIGNNVAIGANAVVTKDFGDDSVVVGIPARVISQDGAAGYVDFLVL